MTAMYRRQECIAQADACRRRAQADPARHDYWIDEATIWLQRAIETGHQDSITYEINDGRMVPKRAH